jgi:GNAT superfamily N-acetyltransferase
MVAADARAVAALTGELGYPVGVDELRRRVDHLRSQLANEVLVAVDDDDRPIGWIHVGRTPTLETSDAALIGGLVVGDAHRDGGIGTALVAAAEAWARAAGATRMVVRSRSTRERAHRFYEDLGYGRVKVSHVFEKPLPDGGAEPGDPAPDGVSRESGW